MDAALARRGFAEALGTGLLVVAVVGSGIAAERLSAGQTGLELLENAAATAGALVAIILAVGPVSGAHLNPIVTLTARAFASLSTREAAVYIGAQLVGGMAGAVVANLMFSLPAVELSTHVRSSGALWLSEVVATMGLLLVIFGVGRSGRVTAAPFAVGAYIGGAYFFTSSTSFANPAVTVARALTDTFAGIAPRSVPAFVGAQLIGAAVAVAVVRGLYPSAGAVAANVVVPHADTDGQPIGPSRLERRGRRRPEPRRPSVSDVGAVPAERPSLESAAAERLARQRLDALARVDEKASGGVPVVLFLCVHNSGRSQMALGWFNHLAGDRAVAWSGGSEPANAVNPAAVAAMAEVGIDISSEFPKPWTEEIVRAADVVVAMGCGDACPVFPGKRYEDWELTDPYGRSVEDVRPIRDEIGRRVTDLLESLGVAATA